MANWKSVCAQTWAVCDAQDTCCATVSWPSPLSETPGMGATVFRDQVRGPVPGATFDANAVVLPAAYVLTSTVGYRSVREGVLLSYTTIVKDVLENV